MAGWFELKSNDKGQFSFSLHGGNGESILRSEQYDSKASAENGINSVAAFGGAVVNDTVRTAAGVPNADQPRTWSGSSRP